MKRVCIYCEKWGAGGIESFLVNVLEHVNYHDLHIDIVAAAVISELFLPRLKAVHVSIYELSGKPHRLLKNYTLFKKILRKNKYDVIHLNVFIAVSFLYAAGAKACGVRKRIVHSHNSSLRQSPLKPLKTVGHVICKHALYRCATDFWACSQEAARFMFPTNRRNAVDVEIVHNGIDTDKFAFDDTARVKMRQQLHVADQFVIGSVGRLSDQKNQKFLVHILKCILKTREKTTLLLIGAGDLTEIEWEAKNIGVRKHVIFYGPANHVEQLLCAMDVFVFPSKFEGFGIAALEAQNSGLFTFCSENVPEEVRVTPLCYRIALDAGAEWWSNFILSTADRATERASYAERISASGYDISTVAAWISAEYLGE